MQGGVTAEPALANEVYDRVLLDLRPAAQHGARGALRQKKNRCHSDVVGHPGRVKG
jgi:hypothetical protein